MSYRFAILVMVIILSIDNVKAQDDTDGLRNWAVNGYLKNLLTFNIVDGFDSVMVDNLLHNRLNFKWYAHDNLTLYLEVRNRVFFGDLVETIPNYADFIDVNDDYLDMSVTAVNTDGLIFHSMVDRAYMEWVNNKWEVRLGRQRVNWGVNLVWNPNDLFNAFSYFDFDYEERPGSDALRVKYYTGFASSLEMAVKAADDSEDFTAAALWKFNKQTYDFQVLAGVSQEDIVAGVGWAGNLKDAGFKGELTYFKSLNNGPGNAEVFLASITVDYSFESSLYLHGSVLFNSDGEKDPATGQFLELGSGKLSTKNLSPYKYSTFTQVSYTFHPLITGGVATMYFPGGQAFFINPTFTFSLKENLDLDAIAQLFFDKQTGDLDQEAKLLFLRMKWSF